MDVRLLRGLRKMSDGRYIVKFDGNKHRRSGRWKWQKSRFFTIKILTTDHSESSNPSELAVSQILSRADPRHEGFRYVRTVLDSFQIPGPSGSHLCLVYAPMRETMSTLQRRLQHQRIPVYLLKPLISLLLTGVEYMHDKCQLIHTGILKAHRILSKAYAYAVRQILSPTIS